jgi:TorA maturation chaperone TorD
VELLRTLAAVMRPPDAAVARVAAMLELPAAPTPAEHAFLFQRELPPFASIYLNPTGEVGGEARDRIVGFWRAAGRTPAAEPDHLADLLAFYAGLLEQELQERDAPRRHALARVRTAFLWEQLLSWVPAYATKVDLIGPRSYRRWAQLVEQVLAREAWRAAPVAATPPALRRAADLPLPAPGDDEALVAYLAAPARSGLVLTRLDVERAADDLRAPMTPCGVREGLAELLRVRPGGFVSWLAAEARRWEQRHERNRDVLPALPDHWVRRARATRALLLAWGRKSAEAPAPPGRAPEAPNREPGESSPDAAADPPRRVPRRGRRTALDARVARRR